MKKLLLITAATTLAASGFASNGIFTSYLGNNSATGSAHVNEGICQAQLNQAFEEWERVKDTAENYFQNHPYDISGTATYLPAALTAQSKYVGNTTPSVLTSIDVTTAGVATLLFKKSSTYALTGVSGGASRLLCPALSDMKVTVTPAFNVPVSFSGDTEQQVVSYDLGAGYTCTHEVHLTKSNSAAASANFTSLQHTMLAGTPFSRCTGLAG